MGQQQLLLVILVTIIVGIATVVALNIFGTAAEQANRDAVRQDLLSAATQAQGVFTRPQMMGGIGQNFDNWATPDLRRLNIPRSSDPADTYTAASIVNDNGTYSFPSAPSGNEITIRGIPAESDPAEWIEVTMTYDPAQRTWAFTWNENTP
jgi:hypothetical protein